eukprot:730820-Lingulodinium_polyedra.AAC.1
MQSPRRGRPCGRPPPRASCTMGAAEAACDRYARVSLAPAEASFETGGCDVTSDVPGVRWGG